MRDIDIIHCLNIKFAEIICNINNFALFSVKIKEKNVKIYSIKRNGRLTYYSSFDFAFFVEQVRIDVMLMGIQKILVNHMLSNEGGVRPEILIEAVRRSKLE